MNSPDSYWHGLRRRHRYFAYFSLLLLVGTAALEVFNHQAQP